jgi:hypothetical protein
LHDGPVEGRGEMGRALTRMDLADVGFIDTFKVMQLGLRPLR